MTITSYAQNFEDVILWRALKHVMNGFYIDVGAQDPVVDSVSFAFYEQGWRGVHVEPTPYYAETIQRARPDEEVLEVAVGIHEDAITFFEFPGTGLSTGDETIARKHEAEGHSVRRISVHCMPLSKILDKYYDRDIHWPKIDVEGMEEQVIDSWLPSPVRPWIVVIESTEPLSTKASFASWESHLLELGYEFVYFDGLNRFYVSRERSELKAQLQVGLNVFDGFALHGQASAPFCKHLLRERTQLSEALRTAQSEVELQRAALSEELDAALSEMELQRAAFKRAAEASSKNSKALMGKIALKTKLLDAKAGQIAELNRQLVDQRKQLAHHKRQISSIYASRSWRLTRPLRTINATASWFIRGARAWIALKPGSRPRRIMKLGFVALTKWRMPVLVGKKVLILFPSIDKRIRSALPRDHQPNAQSKIQKEHIEVERRISELAVMALSEDPRSDLIQSMPPQARSIYFDLKAAVLGKNSNFLGV